MKYVKKLLRLLPIALLLFPMLAMIFNYGMSVNLTDLNITASWFTDIYDLFYGLIGPFEPLLQWFDVNIVDNTILTLSFSVMCYELYLSLIFIMFDLINVIISWTNKFINKGVDLD